MFHKARFWHPLLDLTAAWFTDRGFLFAYDLQLGTWQVRRRELHGEAELV